MTHSPPADRRALLREALRAVESMQARIDGMERARSEPIAIIGMGCRFPGGADTPEAYWRLLRDGVDATSDVPPDRWDVNLYYDPDSSAAGKMITRRGGFLDRLDLFEPSFFGISPREAVSLDPQQRLLLEVAWEALEHAGRAPDGLRGSQTGVFVGISIVDYAKVSGAGETGQTDVYVATGNALNAASGRVSFVLGLHGPAVSVDTACSSSLTATHLACQSLRNGECELALAGGVNVVLRPDAAILFSKWGMLAPDGRCKTFDARADGFVRSEGCGLVVLKRLSAALANGDRILAVIRGSAVNHDGASSGLTVPNGLAQQAVMRRTLGVAGVAPADVHYVEAHGTGTPLGDPIEVEALAAVMDRGRPEEQPLRIGSVKTNIGHAESASGVAGLMKVVLALQHEEIPPHLHLQELNPRIPWQDYRIAIPTERTPWPRGERTRIAGVSSFGFSGTNAHLVVEEAPERPPVPPGVDRPLHLLALSAKSDAALQELAGRYDRHLTTNAPEPLGHICFTANAGRAHFPHRLAVVAASPAELQRKLAALAVGEVPAGMIRGQVQGPDRPKVAFLFTGQGAQYPGMGRQLYETAPAFRKALERCDELLRPHLDRPLLSVLYPKEGEPSPLDETAYTQPALFAVEYALAELWRSWGIEPTVVLGHSLGEYVAACVAGVFSLEDGLKLIAARGRLMQGLPPGGAMAAVFADEARVREAIAAYATSVSLAAINGPQNVVISGRREAVRAIQENLSAAGFKSKVLTVSHAFHSPLMEPMLAEFERVASGLSYEEPRIDLLSNRTGKVVRGAEIDATYWVRHLREAVQFQAGMEALQGLGYEVFLEVGPSPTLLGMGRRCVPEGYGVWLPTLRKGKGDWEQVLTSLGTLYVRGVEVDWAGFDRDYPRRKIALPTYPFQRERFWTEAPARLGRASPAHGHQAHPFLLSHSVLAHPPDTHVFEGQIGVGLFPYLRDHRVQQGVIVPAAAYTEMALSAYALAFGKGPVVLRGIEYRKPLFLSADAAHAVQVVLTPGAGGEAAFHVATRPVAASGAERWTLHVIGRIRGEADLAPEVTQRPSLEAIRAGCPQEVSGAEFYRLLRERGNEWGPMFQGVTRLLRGDGEAWSELSVPAALASQVERYRFHPAVADACGHVLMATVPMERSEGPRGGAFVGGGIDEVRVYRRPQGLRLWAYARLRPTEGERANILVGDLRVFDETGAVVSELRGARLWYLDENARPMARTSMDDWLYEVRWREAPRGEPRRSGAGAARSTWLVVSADGGVGPALADHLRARDQRALLVSPEEAAEAAASRGRSYRGVIYVREPDPCSGRDDHPCDSPARETGVATVVRLVQALTRAAEATTARLWIVTRGAQPVDGNGLRDPLGAALWGLGRSAALEASEVWGGLIDLDPAAPPPEASAFVLDEILAPDADDQVAFRAGRRFGPRLVRLPPGGGGGLALRPDGAYLVTGGLGGLGLLVARWLVECGARRVVLMGRTPLPPRAEWVDAYGPQARRIAAVRELEALGASVHLAPVDVADAAQLSSWLVGYRREAWPPIRGIVHAAGVMQYRSLLDQDEAALDEVMRAKVQGGRLLDRLLADAPLDFFVLFSSASSLLSSPLLGGYAAGNAFLDALAHARRAAGRPALSVNWGMWGEVGMAMRFDAREVSTLALRGMGTIGTEQGLDALWRLLAAGAPQAAVLPVDWGQWVKRYPAFAEAPFLAEVARASPASAADFAPAEAASRRESILAAAPAERSGLVEAFLAAQIAGVMQVPAGELDPQQPLRALGLDSLMAVEIRNRIEAGLGVSLSLVSLLDGPCVAQLTPLVVARLGETAQTPGASPARALDAGRAAELLAALPELGSDEVDALLGEMLESDLRDGGAE